MPRLVGRAAAIVCTMLACGCGGAGTLTSSAALPTKTSVSASAMVHLKFVVPANMPKAKARSKQYVSANTQSLTVTVTPAGGAASAPVIVACTTTCSASFLAPVGTDAIALQLTDGINGAGSQLSLSNTTVTVVANTANTFNLTANPVVDHVSVGLGAGNSTTASVTGGTSSSVAVSLNAMDADGNTIVGPGNYVDALGNPLTLTLQSTGFATAGGGTVALSQTSFTAPPAGPVSATYNGNGVDHVVIGVQSSLPVAGALTGATVTTVPAVTNEYATPGGVGPNYMLLANDGNLWVTAYTSTILRLTPNGAMTAFTASQWPVGLTEDASGNLWAPEQTVIATLSTSAAAGSAATEYALPVVGPFAGAPPQEAIAFGADGKLYTASRNLNAIIKTTTAGSASTIPLTTANSFPFGIVKGPDGNVWFAEFGNNVIAKLTPAGIVTEYPLPAAGSGPRGITVGPDGKLWFTEYYRSYIGTFDPATLQFTEFPVLSAGACPDRISTGPDGALWFSEGCANKIGRITIAGTVTETAIPTAASGPDDVRTAADGTIWFAEFSTSKVGRLVY